MVQENDILACCSTKFDKLPSTIKYCLPVDINNSTAHALISETRIVIVQYKFKDVQVLVDKFMFGYIDAACICQDLIICTSNGYLSILRIVDNQILLQSQCSAIDEIDTYCDSDLELLEPGYCVAVNHTASAIVMASFRSKIKIYSINDQFEVSLKKEAFLNSFILMIKFISTSRFVVVKAR